MHEVVRQPWNAVLGVNAAELGAQLIATSYWVVEHANLKDTLLQKQETPIYICVYILQLQYTTHTHTHILPQFSENTFYNFVLAFPWYKNWEVFIILT